MARLIDAEDLIECLTELESFQEQEGNHEQALGISRAIHDVLCALTVDAIPVEWIEKWRDEKGRHMSERLVAGKIIVDWKWSLSEEDRKKYGID